MAKDLPYFKFFCSEWSDGDITLEDFETQGLFINICAYYWSNECIVSLDKVNKKFKLCSEKCFDNLIKSGIIKVIDGNLSIKFLNEQKSERASKSMVNSYNGKKGGRPKKRIESKKKPNALFLESEPKAKQKAIREEKRREEEKTEEAPSAKSPRGTALPETWTLPDDWKTWAEGARPDVDVLTVADSFRDYWVAKPGKDGRKADWLATWRNWVRNQRSGSAQRPQGAEAVGMFV